MPFLLLIHCIIIHPFHSQSIAQVGADSNFLLKMSANLLIRQTESEPLVTMTAKQFMFGYESAMVTLGNQFLPGWISFDKVGLIDRVSLR